MVEVVDPVADTIVDAKRGVDVGRVVDGDGGVGKGKVVLAVAVEERGRVVEGRERGAAAAEGRDGEVRLVDGRAGEDGVGGVLEERGDKVAAGLQC